MPISWILPPGRGVMDLSNLTTFGGYNGCTNGSSAGFIFFHSVSFWGWMVVNTLSPSVGFRDIKSLVAGERRTS
eukprot:CAMPEP_0201886008 /NCGR_PEP_ID=MMETSP0902-20130614/20930_1 /ASSEMBLY_ACC=CAM_ASM_000551 /TAXON_ID=420261 /ORGANISM="Thalassiosira antarctica, Strain CCMP982" /LENGTH=73 /DNA_ID=CAMNT_0048415457 /DNA_START=1 /DNA_END=222 /DNA_ORIENTATION=-